jgi:biopolymer transport protein ExbD
MVDVTFLLLIFFMVTAAFAMQRSMVVPKPRPEGPVISARAAEPQADIIVEVDEFNTFHVTADGFEQEAPRKGDRGHITFLTRIAAVTTKWCVPEFPPEFPL